MNPEKRRVRNKVIIVAALCVAIAFVALFGLTYTNYRTDGLKGKVEYEPALFNTVLLGQLVDDDVKNHLENMEPSSYTVNVYKCNACHSEELSGSGMDITICPTCGNTDITKTTYQQTLTGKKIFTNLNLNQIPGTSTEFGVGTRDNKLQVAPGSSEENFGLIYFTVTNGTTVQDVYVEGSDEITPQVKNIAESDIRYTIHILTGNNLPLQYELQDLDQKDASGKYITYVLKDTLEKEVTETLEDGSGYTATYIKKDSSSDYVVENPEIPAGTTTPITTSFVNGSRLLKCNHDGSLTVHRYCLKITWPSETTITKTIKDGTTVIRTATETIKNNDLSYMKELENIQILLEVESYVNYFDSQEVDYSSDGLLILNNSQVTTGLYRLVIPAHTVGEGDNQTEVPASEVPVYAKKIVRFDAFDFITSVEAATKLGMQPSYGQNYEYITHIYNTDAVAAEWVADTPEQKTYIDPVTGTSPTRENNGQAPKNGHYTYSSTTQYIGGNYDYHFIVAVPSGPDRMNASAIDWADSNFYKYYVVYNGVTYTGTLTNEVVQSDTQFFDQEASQYEIEPKSQYYAMRFYDSEGNQLALNFSNKELQKEEIALYRSATSIYNPCKDDFHIFLDRSARQ